MRVPDHDSPIRVRWYFVPRPLSGAVDAGPYGSANWDQDDSDPDPPLGEVSSAGYRWRNGSPPPWGPCWASALVAQVDSARALGRVMPAAAQAVVSVDQLRTLSLGVSGGGACVTSVDATRTLGLVASGTGLGVAAISGTITTASTSHAGSLSAAATVAGLSGTTNTGARGRTAARCSADGTITLFRRLSVAGGPVVGLASAAGAVTQFRQLSIAGVVVGPVQVRGVVQQKVVPPISGQGSTPGKVQITVAGCTNGSCTDCANANGAWTLPYAGLSVWALAGPVVCGSGTILHFGNGGSGNTWTFTGLPGATYQVTLGGTWDGVSDITLSLVGSPTQCGYPPTVTVRPVY